ncbi:hypothetical protein FRB94_001206 [Tulasnella sp. JGI-2019a]|nr:hypothetical protein FRB93_010586 [Tulasnella sp. JGI-2019a]KAG9005794.1 hypothetical protein FRB94_001206 [Tulasnella sp. JGI-2019a]
MPDASENPSPWAKDPPPEPTLPDFWVERTSEEPGKRIRQEKLRCTLIGVAAGAASAILGRQVYRFSPNQVLLAGSLTGITSYASGRWILSQSSTKTEQG